MLCLTRRDEFEPYRRAFALLGWYVASSSIRRIASDLDTVRPDFVVTDALDTLRAIRAAPTGANTYVVVLCDDDQGSVANAWSAGADWVVPRPVDPDDPLGFRSFV